MKRGNRAALGVMLLGVGYLIYLFGTAAAPDALTCSLANSVRHGSCNPATGTAFIIATVVAVFIGAVLLLTALANDSDS